MTRILLNTRPSDAAARFGDALAEAMPGVWTSVPAPLLEIRARHLGAPLEDAMAAAGGVIFTSAAAVGIAADAAAARPPAHTVGPKTAEAAEAAGFPIATLAPDAERLLAALTCTPPAALPLLHCRGRHTTKDLAAALTEAGIASQGMVVYDQHPCPLTPRAAALLVAGKVAVLPVFSPRSARLLASILAAVPPVSLASTAAFALSPAVARPLTRLPLARITIAAEPTGAAMLAALAERLTAPTRVTSTPGTTLFPSRGSSTPP